MSAERASALLSLSVAVLVLAASYLQWWDITYGGKMRTRKWVRLLLAMLIAGLVSAVVLLVRADDVPDREGSPAVSAVAVLQVVAVAIAAFAAWQARRSAMASQASVAEMRAAREEDAWLRQRTNLDAIRRLVLHLKQLTDQRQEGTPTFRELQGELRALLPPPFGKQELLVCQDLAEARSEEAALAERALREIENVIVAWEGSGPGR